MALHGGIDGSEPVGPERVGDLAGPQEKRRTVSSRLLGIGTLACPACDAPVAPVGVMSPTDRLGCGFCARTGVVRDFLSLADPSRPARVAVRLVPGGR